MHYMPKAAKSTKVDPIFAAIKAHKAAVVAHQPIGDKYMSTSFKAPDWNAIVIETEASFDVVRALQIELTNIKPTSGAGVMALLAYVTEQTDGDHIWMDIDLIDEDAGDTEPRSFEACLIRSCAVALAQINGVTAISARS
jgi:hypothetical protein